MLFLLDDDSYSEIDQCQKPEGCVNADYSSYDNKRLFSTPSTLIGGEQHIFDQVNWILQSSAVTFFTCGGQEQKHFCQISSASGFCVPKITKIGLFLTEVSEKRRFSEPRCSLIVSQYSPGVSH